MPTFSEFLYASLFICLVFNLVVGGLLAFVWKKQRKDRDKLTARQISLNEPWRKYK
jgi:nicotinamide riboside transporter PnuC